MIRDLACGFARKQNCEFFSSAPVSLPSTGHPCQLGCHQAQHLVSGVMAKGVVETLEVIDIDHRDRIWMLQAQKRVVTAALRSQVSLSIPWFIRLFFRIPYLRDLPARLIAFGPVRVRLET